MGSLERLPLGTQAYIRTVSRESCVYNSWKVTQFDCSQSTKNLCSHPNRCKLMCSHPNRCKSMCACTPLLPECACIHACPSMSSIPQPFRNLLYFCSISSRLDGVLPPHEGGHGDGVDLGNRQLIDVSDLQYGLQKDDHVKPLCCCTHYKHQAKIDTLN